MLVHTLLCRYGTHRINCLAYYHLEAVHGDIVFKLKLNNNSPLWMKLMLGNPNISIASGSLCLEDEVAIYLMLYNSD